jgi:WD40 repeat protein
MDDSQAFSTETELSALARDSIRFLLEFHGPIRLNAMAVYSIVYWTPHTTIFHRIYSVKSINTVQVLSGGPADWPSCRYTLEGHTAGGVHSVAFSPDGSQVMSASRELIHFWDVKMGTTIGGPIAGDFGDIVALSPDGNKIATFPRQGTALLYDTQTHRPIGDLFGEPAPEIISAASFSPDGHYIVSGSEDNGIVRLWDANTGSQVGVGWRGHTLRVTSIKFSPNGRRVISGSRDCTVRFWDTKSGRQLGSPMKEYGDITCVAFSTNGTQCTYSFRPRDTTIYHWDVETRCQIGRPWKGHTGGVTCLGVSPDGRFVVSGSADQDLRLWDWDGVSIGIFRGHSLRITSIAFSPGSRQIVSGSDDCTIRIWDIDARAPVNAPRAVGPRGLQEFVHAVALSPDGGQAPVGMNDGDIHVYNVETGSLISRDQRRYGVISAIAFSPDRRRLVSGSEDQTIRLWDVGSHRLLYTRNLPRHAEVTSLAFSPDGDTLLSSSPPIFWSLRGDEVHLAENWDPYEDKVPKFRSVALSPSGSHVTGGALSGDIHTWELKTGVPTGKPIEGHNTPVVCISFSRAGIYIISRSGLDRMLVHDIASRQQLSSFHHEISLFSPTLCLDRVTGWVTALGRWKLWWVPAANRGVFAFTNDGILWTGPSGRPVTFINGRKIVADCLRWLNEAMKAEG